MEAILQKCQLPDFEYLSTVLDNWASFTNDKRRHAALRSYRAYGDEASRLRLVQLLDKQIRYFGSADFAYLWRHLLHGGGGVEPEKIVTDVCEKLGVEIKRGGSLEARLERLVAAVVERELLAKRPRELKREFLKISHGGPDLELVLEHIKSNAKVAVIPLLVQLLGPKVTLEIVEMILVGLVAQLVGREAAKALVKEIGRRNPYLHYLGPAMWSISAAWLALDLQGPAYRKTIPVCLYLGLVALRDGMDAADSDP